MAILAGVPIATLGFAFRLGKDELDVAAAVLGGAGLVAFLVAGFQLVKAVWVRNVSFGIPQNELRKYARDYENDTLKEWVADLLVKSSEHNYAVMQTKLKHLQAVFPFLVLEVLLFLAASAYLLFNKL